MKQKLLFKDKEILNWKSDFSPGPKLKQISLNVEFTLPSICPRLLTLKTLIL